MSIFGNISFIN
ncbi:hypothetical protein BpHYR1_033277 [Brachionus plicatilis]|uniref:Uncharacterized protein n=1 Tax=Brachionus plicatilis TaxID=10195 RepID=A0A3M7QZW1_BRAPC|nr:hypothetical protein BpHYR1_033277 [Brachionus plicatilis]